MKIFFKSVPSAMLILLFTYAAIFKLLDFAAFNIQLRRQTIPLIAADFLSYAIPALEIIAVILLLSKRTLLTGLKLSLTLLLVFSGYIALVLLHFWNRIPCACGGILSHMSWSVHLGFNVLFILLTLISISIYFKERRAVT